MTFSSHAPQSARPSRPKRHLWLTGVGLFVLILTGIAISVYAPSGQANARNGRDPGKGAPVNVVTATAVRGISRNTVDALGTVTSLNTVTVNSRVDGQLMRLHYRDGQQVKAGELLAEIDPRPFQIQLEQGQAALARDQAQLTNAELDLRRYETLYEQDSVAKQQLDAQKALVLQYRANIKADQANIDNAHLQLSYSRITAPISGRIGFRLVDAGNLVQANSRNGLAVITQESPITVVFALPQDKLQAVLERMRTGTALEVDAYDRSFTQKLASGKLTALNNQVDTSTGTVNLKATFANKDGKLFPSQFVNTRLILSSNDRAVLIPTAAIQNGSIGTFVWRVLPNHTVSAQKITPGPVNGNQTTIAAGLQSGDVVVLEGVDKLHEGIPVALLPGASGS